MTGLKFCSQIFGKFQKLPSDDIAKEETLPGVCGRGGPAVLFRVLTVLESSQEMQPEVKP